MNIKLILKLLGRILLVESVALLLPLVVALLYREDPMPFVWSILISAGGLCLGGSHLADDRRGGRSAFLLLRLFPLLCGLLL